MSTPLIVKAFELSQSLREKWLTADYAAKRRILEILCLNCSLDGVSLVATMRKPFDLLAKGLVSKDSRGDCPSFEPLIRTVVSSVLATGTGGVDVTRLVRISA